MAVRNTSSCSELHDEWGRIVFECSPQITDIITPLLFDAGFTGFEENEQDGRILITAYYLADSALQDPTIRFYEMLEQLPGINATQDIRTKKADSIEREDSEENWRRGPVCYGNRRPVPYSPFMDSVGQHRQSHRDHHRSQDGFRYRQPRHHTPVSRSP